MKIFRLVIVLLVYGQACLHAQVSELIPKTEEPDIFSFGLSAGAVSLDGDIYNSLAAKPELDFGKFGIGLDIDFRFTLTSEDGDIAFRVYEEDWYLKEGTFTEYLNLYLSKIAFIRFGQPGEDLYARMGSLSSTTMGSGFMVHGYTNTLFEPEKKIFGADFNFDSALFGFPLVGFQAFVGNMSQWDTFGGRLFFRPFGMTKLPILEGLQIGTAVYMDTQPKFHFDDDDDNNDGIYDQSGIPEDFKEEQVVIFDFDTIIPIIKSDIFSLDLLGDFAIQGIAEPKYGGMSGFRGSMYKHFLFGGQIRYLGDDFQAEYFNSTYDLDRMKKQILYTNKAKDTAVQPAHVGYMGTAGVAFLDNHLIFLSTLQGRFISPKYDADEAPWEYPHLTMSFVLDPGTLPVLDFLLFYDKQGIDSFQSLFSAENAIMGGKVNFNIEGAIVSFVIDAKYDPEDNSEWTVSTRLVAGMKF